MKIKHVIGCLLLIFTAVPAAANFLPEQSAVPGGVILVDLPNSSSTPVVHFNEHRVMTLQQQQNWLAVVGLPLTLQPGEHQLTVTINNQPQSIPFQVVDKQYESQHITLKNKRQVNPNPLDMERIGKESKQIKTALRQWRESSGLTELSLPVTGRLSSPFGLRRYFNEQARKPHSGVDIAAPTGTPILAPADGIITRTGSYFFNGNTLFIDHGQGLVTMYCHMETMLVKEGAEIKRGEQIGTIGSTGRATGPHLHWGVSLNDARIDPALLSPELQALQNSVKE